MSEEKERQMEERRKEEEKHQVVENQLKRQGKYNNPNCCPFFETVYICNDDTHVYQSVSVDIHKSTNPNMIDSALCLGLEP